MKAMYRHGDEGQRLPSHQNHLDMRDTVSADWLHYQRNTHTYVSAPWAPVVRWSALVFCAWAGEDVWRGGRGDVGERRLPR